MPGAEFTDDADAGAITGADDAAGDIDASTDAPDCPNEPADTGAELPSAPTEAGMESRKTGASTTSAALVTADAPARRGDVTRVTAAGAGASEPRRWVDPAADDGNALEGERVDGAAPPRREVPREGALPATAGESVPPAADSIRLARAPARACLAVDRGVLEESPALVPVEPAEPVVSA